MRRREISASASFPARPATYVEPLSGHRDGYRIVSHRQMEYYNQRGTPWASAVAVAAVGPDARTVKCYMSPPSLGRSRRRVSIISLLLGVGNGIQNMIFPSVSQAVRQQPVSRRDREREGAACQIGFFAHAPPPLSHVTGCVVRVCRSTVEATSRE